MQQMEWIGRLNITDHHSGARLPPAQPSQCLRGHPCHIWQARSQSQAARRRRPSWQGIPAGWGACGGGAATGARGLPFPPARQRIDNGGAE